MCEERFETGSDFQDFILNQFNAFFIDSSALFSFFFGTTIKWEGLLWRLPFFIICLLLPLLCYILDIITSFIPRPDNQRVLYFLFIFFICFFALFPLAISFLLFHTFFKNSLLSLTVFFFFGFHKVISYFIS